MEHLTLTDAAVNHHNEVYGMPKDFKPIELTERQHANNIHAAFKAGAEWQKEQLKAKWEAMSSIMENGLAKDLVDRVAAQLLQD